MKVSVGVTVGQGNVCSHASQSSINSLLLNTPNEEGEALPAPYEVDSIS